MPIIHISESIELYKEFENKFVSPYNTNRVLIKVQLYRQIISTGLVENIKKKPLVIFYFASDGKDIPKKDWTHEMKQSATQYELDYPVSNAGKKYSLFGKILFGSTGIGLTIACAAIFYLLYFKVPQQKNGYAEFIRLPKIGDKYYGSIMTPLTDQYKSQINHGWIKIIAVNPVDSIISYTTSLDIGQLTFDTLQADHTNFDVTVLNGKFRVNKKSNIHIISIDKKTRFESTVISNKTDHYKISAN